MPFGADAPCRTHSPRCTRPACQTIPVSSSHGARQLKGKAEGYGEYAELEGWRQRNEYCPPLLFITTSEKRAHSFLATCGRAVDQQRMLVAATGLARDIDRSLVAPRG